MRRLALLATVGVASLLAVLSIGSSPHVTAKGATPSAMAGHPLIGAWLADVDVNDPNNPPSLIIFHDDGTYIQSDPDGSNGVGTWEATGPRTAALTALFQNQTESGALAGTVKVRAAITVDASGNAWTADYTLEFIQPNGASSGQMGPGKAAGKRIAVEPMGTPVGPIQMGTPTS
jgi:hypothetical protein